MSTDSNILREYLVALGFQVNRPSEKKAETSMHKMEVNAGRLAKTVMGVAAAAQTMVAVFAVQMEKLYYASKRTDSTVGNLQALEYGGKQVGLVAGSMTASMEAMARAIRANPGLSALLESLGVEVKGRDKADVLIDLVTQLRRMPFYVAQQYASMFGIDADTLFMMQEGLDKMKEAQALRKKMAAEAGVDTEKAAAAAVEYSNALREVWERVGLLKDALAIKLLPSFREFAGVVIEFLKDWTRLINSFKDFEDFATRLKEGFTGKATGGGVQLSEDTKRRLGITGEAPAASTWWDRMMESKRRFFGGSEDAPPQPAKNAPGSVKAPSQGGNDAQAKLRALESKYGLPAGWLDKVWNKESKRGDPRFMKSKAGALGHFQFMPDTAKQYGLKNPYDFDESADAAGRYFRDLFRKYKGDAAMAAGAYNWGPGNMDKYALGKKRMPKETQDYVGSIAGVQLHQENHITVTGVQDPAKAAGFVAENQARANDDLVRQFKPRVL